MKNKYAQEIILIVLTLFPLLLMFLYWEQLPDQVATHFNLSGEPDDWTSKRNLPFLFGGICIITYLILLVVPKIDPKKEVFKMGQKYFIVKFIAIALVSFTFSLAVISSVENISFNSLYPYILILFFIILGNYLPSVKPNYFIGIRTPWTLESRDIWNKTHRFAGKLWVIGGLIMLLTMLLIPLKNMTMLTIVGTLILALIPTVYSYLIYKKNF